MHIGAARQNENAGCVVIEAVDDQRIGEFLLHAADEAVLLVFAAPGYRQQARRFADCEQRTVGVKEGKAREGKARSGGDVIRMCRQNRRGGHWNRAAI